jgi:hypothetical protein
MGQDFRLETNPRDDTNEVDVMREKYRGYFIVKLEDDYYIVEREDRTELSSERQYCIEDSKEEIDSLYPNPPPTTTGK